MDTRPRRENIKKPSRYESTESDEDVSTSQKKKLKISMTDEINDIRNVARHGNKPFSNNETMTNISACIRPASLSSVTLNHLLPRAYSSASPLATTSATDSSSEEWRPATCLSTCPSALPLESAKEQELIPSTSFPHTLQSVSSPHLEQSTSLPVSNCEVLSRKGETQKTYFTSTICNTTATIAFQNSSSACTSTMSPVTSIITPLSSTMLQDTSSYITSQPLYSCTTEHVSSGNLQPLYGSPISSLQPTSYTHITSAIHNRQTYNEMYPYEVSNNTVRFAGNLETSAQNTTKCSATHECSAVSSACQVSSLASVVRNNLNDYTPCNNNQSKHNEDMGQHITTYGTRFQNITSTPFPRPLHQSHTLLEASNECDISLPTSLTLLSSSVAHTNNNCNTASSNETISSHAHISEKASNNRNNTLQNENIHTRDMTQTQIMEYMKTVMAEVRMTNERLNRRLYNRRRAKPKIIPFEKVEDVIEFNQSSDAKYADMVEYLASIGGRNLRDCISFVFKEVFNTNVALSFTWSGNDNNNRPTKKKFSDLRITDALFDAVSTNFQLTMSDFKYHISEALRSAKQRHRHQERLREKEN